MVELVSTAFEDAKSLRTGYTDVGISFDPNKSVSAALRKMSDAGAVPSRKGLYELDVDAADLQIPEDAEMQEWKETMEIPELKSKGRNIFLAPFERAYWQRLIAKYGTDYKAMSRDIKLNNYQHTELVCKKKVAIFMEKYNDDLSRKTPAPRRRELRKAENAARRAAAAASAPKKEEDEEEDEESSEEDLLEEMAESDLEEQVSSDEEEFAPPAKKKAALPPKKRVK